MNAFALLQICRKLGLSLQPRGADLFVRPASRATPELLAQIRAHKPALRNLLEAESAQLTPDCAPWLHISRQIMAGEFDGGRRSLLDSLLIGVWNIPHPGCQQARTRLESMIGRVRKEGRL